MSRRFRLRPFWLAALVAVAFVLGTTSPDWMRPDRNTVAPAPFWTEAQSTSLTREEVSNIDIYNRASPATVNITSTVLKRGWFFEMYPVEESGSGFLVDAEGRILTNHHVIKGDAPQLEVTLADKSRHKAEVLATDEANDLALIRIKTDEPLEYLTLGHSDNLEVGQKVLAIGNPFGLEGTLTTGIISSLDRSIRTRDGVLEAMIQTDAAINPGNSGGPLLDSSGNVIGVNTAIYGPGGNIGIGFAMPIGRAKPLLEYIATGGKSRRPQPIGLRHWFLSDRAAETLDLPSAGLLVTEVRRGSAAHEAGLRGATREVILGNYVIPWGGDFIVEVDGRKVTHQRALSQVMSLKHGDDTVRLKVIREGDAVDVSVALKSAPARLRF